MSGETTLQTAIPGSRTTARAGSDMTTLRTDSPPAEVHSVERDVLPPAPPRQPATLAAPVRIAIVLQLHSSARCVHELVEALGVTQPLISQHLRVLKAAGVVAGERHGREVVYRLVDDHLAHIVMDAVAHVEEET
jgi:ArsR family transcriptional regulator